MTEPVNWHQRAEFIDLKDEVERLMGENVQLRERTIREVAEHLRRHGEWACCGFEKEAAAFVGELLD